MVNLPLPQLKAAFNNWRVAFLAFLLIYAFFVMLGMPQGLLKWDEIIHLNGGLFLFQGQFDRFMTSNAFYPPLFDGMTLIYFKIFGISVLSARLVSFTFSLLSLWAVFELGNKLYGPKVGLISSVLLGLMPGFFWQSRVAMIETMLVFFFTFSLLFFFNWLKNRHDKWIVLSGIALGLGFLTKYQVLIAAIIMILSILFLARNQLKQRLTRFSLLIIVVIAISAVWIVIAYQVYAENMLSTWLYALQTGNPEKLVYIERFPLPVFYFVEMTWPYDWVHPVSLFLYIVSIAGLGLHAWRRKLEDKYLLIWFVTTFVFFTLIPNKHWRYVMPLFPVLAIAGASLIVLAYSKLQKSWRQQVNVNKKVALKAVAVLFSAFLIASAAFSANDAFDRMILDQVSIELEAATGYAASHLEPDESIMLLCATDLFSQDMIRFYLWADGTKHNEVWQYPELPVDTYTPEFNVTELVELCRERKVKYVFTYELGGTVTYFNSTLNLQQVYLQLYQSGSFQYLSGNAKMEDLIKNGSIPAFGVNPRRIFILTFAG